MAKLLVIIQCGCGAKYIFTLAFLGLDYSLIGFPTPSPIPITCTSINSTCPEHLFK